MDDRFDVIVIGMGPGGEVASSQLLAAGKRVAIIERELIGGERAYWACIPSKTLLRPPEAKSEVDRAAGVAGTRLDWPSTRDYRDHMIRNLDDGNQVEGYEKSGATVIEGAARITGPGAVEVNGRTLTAEHLVIATGSDALIPPIEGLEQVPVWTNREATTLTDIPHRVVMIGGSAVGAELGLFLRRYGAEITILVLERSGRLLSREDPRPGQLVREHRAAGCVGGRPAGQRVGPYRRTRCPRTDPDRPAAGSGRPVPRLQRGLPKALQRLGLADAYGAQSTDERRQLR